MFNVHWNIIIYKGQSYYEMKQIEIELIILKFWDSCQCGYGIFDLTLNQFCQWHHANILMYTGSV